MRIGHHIRSDLIRRGGTAVRHVRWHEGRKDVRGERREKKGGEGERRTATLPPSVRLTCAPTHNIDADSPFLSADPLLTSPPPPPPSSRPCPPCVTPPSASAAASFSDFGAGRASSAASASLSSESDACCCGASAPAEAARGRPGGCCLAACGVGIVAHGGRGKKEKTAHGQRRTQRHHLMLRPPHSGHLTTLNPGPRPSTLDPATRRPW